MGNCTKPPLVTGGSDSDDLQLPAATLTLRASTWQRDSHELFDYESPNIQRRALVITNPTALLRDENDDLTEVAASDVIKTNKHRLMQPSLQKLVEPILHVNTSKGGFYSVYDKVHFLDSKLKPIVVTADAPPKGKLK
jgi:hypothetical protein